MIPNGLDFDSALEALKGSYGSVDLRSLVAKIGDEWQNVVTVARFTEKTTDEVKREHETLKRRLGSVDTDRLKIVQTAVSPSAINPTNLVASGSLRLGEFRIRLRAAIGAASDIRRMVPNHYLLKGEEAEYDFGVSTTSTLESLDIFLNKAKIDPPRFGLPTISDIVTSRLGLDGVNYTSDVFFALPFYVKLESLSFSPSDGAKFSGRVHRALLDKVTVVLARKSERRILLETKRLKRDDFRITEKHRFAFIKGQTVFETTDSTDLIAADLTLQDIGLVDQRETPASPAEIRPPSLATKVRLETDPRRIFIVHGHDETLKNQLEIFLTENGLEGVVLHRKPDEGRTIIEKLETYGKVSYAFVLLTPDDEVKDSSKSEFRARQNVIFELGYFIGLLGRNRVCCLYKPGVVLPTDISGIVYKKVTTDVQSIGYDLLKELRAAGYTPR
ncbi:MAG: TIR domain-containing protein [Candidatus Bathyarchaeia archaeon]